MGVFKHDEESLMKSILKESNNFPITSAKKNLMNKNLDYKVLMLMTLLSNAQPYVEAMETGKEERWRYLYRNKLKEYQHLVENLSKNKLNSIYKTIKKMEKLDCKVIAVRKTEGNDIVYDINYGVREYVTIETKIMEALIHSFNSTAIKVYVLLKYMCRNGKRKISQEWILKQIGLSSDSWNNRRSLRNITTELHCGGYINKETVIIDGNKKVNYYEVNSLDEWREIRKLGNRQKYV